MEPPGRFIIDKRPQKEAEIQRLIRLSEYYRPLMEKIFTQYKNLDIERGYKYRRIIDIGAGTGHTTVLLKEIFSEAEVTYFDSSIQLSEAARDNAKKGGYELIFINSDIHTFILSQCYDLVFCRFALKHFYDPILVIRKMVEILNPGGRILLMDKDVTANIWYPTFPLYRSRFIGALNRYNEQSHRGGDSSIGRKMKTLLGKNSIKKIEADIISNHLTGPENALYRELHLGVYTNLLPELVQAGLITPEEGRRDIDRLKIFMDNPDYLAISFDFIATGIKE